MYNVIFRTKISHFHYHVDERARRARVLAKKSPHNIAVSLLCMGCYSRGKFIMRHTKINIIYLVLHKCGLMSNQVECENVSSMDYDDALVHPKTNVLCVYSKYWVTSKPIDGMSCFYRYFSIFLHLHMRGAMTWKMTCYLFTDGKKSLYVFFCGSKKKIKHLL
jgi:hypothetical protein